MHRIVSRARDVYERYNELIGAGRQLTLKLAEPGSENGVEAVPQPADA